MAHQNKRQQTATEPSLSGCFVVVLLIITTVIGIAAILTSINGEARTDAGDPRVMVAQQKNEKGFSSFGGQAHLNTILTFA